MFSAIRKLFEMISPSAPSHQDVAPHDPELARQAERLVAQVTPRRPSNEMEHRRPGSLMAQLSGTPRMRDGSAHTDRRSPSPDFDGPAGGSNSPPRNRPVSPAPIFNGAVGGANSPPRNRPASPAPIIHGAVGGANSRRRPASPARAAPPARIPCRIDARSNIKLPRIAAHRLVANHRIEFLVQYDRNRTHDEWLQEHQIQSAVVAYKLHDYKVNTSGVKYKGRGGNFKVAEVLDHRIAADGTVVYFVGWAGKYTDPVWRSEPINPRDNAQGVYAQYNLLHGLPQLPA